jgi:hypothetical protein
MSRNSRFRDQSIVYSGFKKRLASAISRAKTYCVHFSFLFISKALPRYWERAGSSLANPGKGGAG